MTMVYTSGHQLCSWRSTFLKTQAEGLTQSRNSRCVWSGPRSRWRWAVCGCRRTDRWWPPSEKSGTETQSALACPDNKHSVWRNTPPMWHKASSSTHCVPMVPCWSQPRRVRSGKFGLGQCWWPESPLMGWYTSWWSPAALPDLAHCCTGPEVSEISLKTKQLQRVSKGAVA